jgi:DNA-binding transcriptional MerR regulator
MPSRRTYQVKEVAGLSGLTVRALHHYDAIGLLEPSARSAAGYRLYSDDDLMRLQQIIVGRGLGLSLEAIRRSLDDPAFDQREALLAQRAELAARVGRTNDMIRAIDAALSVIEEKDMSKADFKKIFDGFDPSTHEDEVKQCWGQTDAYKISAQRTKSYTEADWQRFKDEQAAICADVLAAIKDGVRSVRWMSPSATVCRSIAGSILADRGCTAASRTSGKRTAATPRASTSMVPV